MTVSIKANIHICESLNNKPAEPYDYTGRIQTQPEDGSIVVSYLETIGDCRDDVQQIHLRLCPDGRILYYFSKGIFHNQYTFNGSNSEVKTHKPTPYQLTNIDSVWMYLREEVYVKMEYVYGCGNKQDVRQVEMYITWN